MTTRPIEQPTAPLTRRRFLGSAGGAIVAATAVSGCELLATEPAQNAGGEGGRRPPEGLESPMLARRVEEGSLPPLPDRIPADPLVVEPLKSVGRYGGTLRGVALGPETSNDIQTAMLAGLFRFSDDLSERYPEVAEAYELSDDFRSCIITLRKGIRWSDGVPLTADDVMFYFEDWQFDEEISPVLSTDWIQGGEPMQVTKVDDLTVRFDFAIPFPGFSLLNETGRPATPFVPRHFMESLHPRYTPDVREAAEEAGYENWQDQFLRFAETDWGEQAPERPVLSPWMPVHNDQLRQRYVRNPYYWKVDTDGRQLPYVDEVVVDYVSDTEVLLLKALAGDLDVCALSLLPANYPLLKKGEEDGEYRTLPLTSVRGAEVAVAFNQEHKDPVLKAIFNDIRFRRATSVAINREQINKLVFLNQGTPRQATVNEEASFFKPEWAEAYAQFDIDLANELLDEMGLAERDAEGVRLRPDGAPLTFLLEFTPLEGPKDAVVELVVEDWKKVGLGVSASAREKNYLVSRLEGGDHDASAWHVERQLERAAYCARSYLRPGGDSSITYAFGWRAWLDSGGKSGIEPPQEAKDLQALFDDWPRYEMGTPEYREAAVKIYDLVAETLWVIGTVGQGIAPVVVKNGLENVFSDAVYEREQRVWWGGDNWIWLPHRADQWFFSAD